MTIPSDPIFEALPDDYILVDSSGIILNVTTIYLREMKKSRAEVVGLPLTDLFPFLAHSLEKVKAQKTADKFLHPILDETQELCAYLFKKPNDPGNEILDMISDGFFSLDADLRFTNANPVTLSYFRKSLEDILYRHLDEFSPIQSDRARFRDRYLEVLRTGVPLHFTEKYGEIVLETSAYRTKMGEIAVFFKDVTVARVAEERLKVITDQLSAFVAYIDKEGRYQFVNKTYEKWFKKPASAILGKKRLEFADPKTTNLAEDYEKKALAGTPARYENVLPGPDARDLHLDVQYLPHIDSLSGEVVGAVVVGHDVTNLKSAYKEADVARRELALLLHNAPVAIALLEGKDLTYTMANQKFYEIFGFKDILGKHLREVILRKESLQIVTRVFETGSPYEAEELEIPLSGSESVYIHWIVNPHFDFNGKIKGVMIVCNDITALVKSKHEAEVAVQIRDEFLSIASHELKTPLTSLQLHTQLSQKLMASQGLPPDVSQRIGKSNDILQRSVKRLSTLVDDMLDISRIHNGKLTLNLEEFSLNALVMDVVERLTPQLEMNGISVNVDQDLEVFGIWDRYRLEQVIVNLITNSMKYGERTPITISLKAEGKKAILSVSDEGPGISPEDQLKIFQRFERVGDKNVASGLGLGLFICKEIIERHDGTITVASAPGKGATFTVTLPRE